MIKEQKPDGLKEKIEALAKEYVKDPDSDYGDYLLHKRLLSAGAAAGIALVLAEMERYLESDSDQNPYDARSLIDHIKQFTKGIDAK